MSCSESSEEVQESGKPGSHSQQDCVQLLEVNVLAWVLGRMMLLTGV